MIARDIHAQFFQNELVAIEQAVSAYWDSNCSALYNQGRLCKGIYLGIDERQGNCFFRFRRGFTPRLGQSYLLFTVKEGWNTSAQWDAGSYRQLRAAAVLGSDGHAIFRLKYQEDPTAFLRIAFSDLEDSFVENIKPGTFVVAAELDPPFEYIRNLKLFVEKSIHGSIGILLSPMENMPTNEIIRLSGANTAQTIIEATNQAEMVAIQGPPGTGKTYQIANFCNYQASQGKSVMVIAQSNHALMEIALKDGLSELLQRLQISKTRLSVTERKKLPSLQKLTEVLPVQGSVHLVSYYSFMRYVAKYINEGRVAPKYDFIIVEEMSQAFYATIIAAKSVAHRLIGIGDPAQLEPIVQQANPTNLHPNIYDIINGAKSFLNKVAQKSYQLTDTFRLTTAAAAQTSKFYSNPLVSHSIKKQVVLMPEISGFFSDDGSTSICFLSLQDEGRRPISAIQLVRRIVQAITLTNLVVDIAVLSPYRDTAKGLQDAFDSDDFDANKVIIDTVDKVQGMTCNFTIYVIPFGGLFGFEPNRFNVATSRATSGTLIITDAMYADYSIFTNQRIREFLSLCEVVKA
jgi:DNA replication ATP-dependent helicase Dna2